MEPKITETKKQKLRSVSGKNNVKMVFMRCANQVWKLITKVLIIECEICKQWFHAKCA